MLALSVAVLSSACTAEALQPLDLDSTDAVEPTRASPKTSSSDGTGSATPVPVPADLPDAAAAPTGCDASVNGAIFCDSFESAQLETSWSKAFTGGSTHFDTKRFVTGAQSLVLGFGTLPATGKAALELQAPAIAKERFVSLRFHVFLPSDGYPVHLPLGGIYDASGKGIRFALDHSSTLVAEDTTSGGAVPIDSFAIALGKWSCAAITLDRVTLQVTIAHDSEAKNKNTNMKPAALDRASIGLVYDEGANPNASVAAWYDDVAVASSALSCP